MRTIATALIATLVLGLALTACGRRSGLEPPPGAHMEFPRQYPDPEDK
jgi:predicted small lipoprotein YifL